ncbi:MAG TPA: zf-HC2 domain-containing protein [Anaeromyxobacteraceae bacterium]|nr:zf-HC2 domain-containing protein [Anaeromyxobacteraceae bacterium]
MTRHLDDALAQGYVDGLLPGPDRAACADHLAGCADCALLVDSYRALTEALDDLDAPLPPAGFTQAVMAAVDERERAHAWERRLALGIVGVAACAAVALFAAAGASAWAPALSGFFDGLAPVVTLATVAADALRPVVGALRLQIAVACAAAALPLLFALSRLVPRGAEVSAS